MGPFVRAAAYYAYNSFVTHVPSYSLRTWFLRNVLKITLGRGVAIHMGCFFTGNRISIGDCSVINRGCYLDGRVGISIGANVSISPHVHLLSLTHDTQDPWFGTLQRPCIVEDFVWVGARATVLPGVTLHRGCAVGAGAVVTRSAEAYSVVAGVPARKIGERCRDLQYSLRYFPYFNTDELPPPRN